MDENTRQMLLKACQQAGNKNLFNLLNKLNKGQALSKAQMLQLDDATRQLANDTTEPHPKYGHLPQWAKSKVEAAILLGWRSRNYFSLWRRRKPDDAPPENSNGRENCWEWFDFMEKFGIKPDKDEDDPVAKKHAAESRKVEAQAEMLEERLKRLKSEVIPLPTVNRNYTLAILKCKNKLMSLGNTLAPKLASCAADPEMVKELINEHVWEAMEPLAKSPHNGFACPECGHAVKLAHES